MMKEKIRKTYIYRGLSTYVWILTDNDVIPDTVTEDKCQWSIGVKWNEIENEEQLYDYNNWIRELDKKDVLSLDIQGKDWKDEEISVRFPQFKGTYNQLCLQKGYAKVVWPTKNRTSIHQPREQEVYLCKDHLNKVAKIIFGNNDVPVYNHQYE